MGASLHENTGTKMTIQHKAPLIFVWLGSKLPNYAKYFLEFSQLRNPSLRIILVSNHLHKRNNKLKNIEFVHIPNDMVSNLELISMPDKFFFNTSARFIYLSKAIERLHLTSFFHAELDNAVFNLDGLQQSLDKINSNCLFAPQDSQDRGIASLIYCNNPRHIREMMRIITNKNFTVDNDMEAIGVFAKLYTSSFYALPTESFMCNSKTWKVASPYETDGIFDAATIGQYLLGINKQYFSDKDIYNLFINTNCKIDLSLIRFIFCDNQLYIDNLQKSRTKLYNLHVHSKSVSMFRLMISKSDFLSRVNNGDKILIKKASNALILIAIKIKSKLIKLLRA